MKRKRDCSLLDEYHNSLSLSLGKMSRYDYLSSEFTITHCYLVKTLLKETTNFVLHDGFCLDLELLTKNIPLVRGNADALKLWNSIATYFARRSPW